MIYGYCRVSTPRQSVDRQIRNIRAVYPDARIFVDRFTGTRMNRPEWNKLRKQLRSGDICCCDEINRLSRNAEEGMAVYEELCAMGVNLVFIQQHHLDTDIYKSAVRQIPLTDTPVDSILEGVNKYLMYLVKEQIRLAFAQGEEEVKSLHRRTSEGIETARRAGKQIGRKPGAVIETKKSREVKERIRKDAKAFGGTYPDKDLIELCHVAKNTYYKYKRELISEVISDSDSTAG